MHTCAHTHILQTLLSLSPLSYVSLVWQAWWNWARNAWNFRFRSKNSSWVFKLAGMCICVWYVCTCVCTVCVRVWCKREPTISNNSMLSFFHFFSYEFCLFFVCIHNFFPIQIQLEKAKKKAEDASKKAQFFEQQLQLSQKVHWDGRVGQWETEREEGEEWKSRRGLIEKTNIDQFI